MKKIIALTLALGMTVGIASACGKKAEPVEEETEAKIEEETEEEVEDETEPVVTEEVTEASKASEGVVNNVPSTTAEYGVLYTIIDDKNDDQHYIKGVSLGGNQTGSSEFNSKEPATDSIRCVFLLNEWISVTLDDEAPDEVQVYVFKFVDDLSLYKDVDFNGACLNLSRCPARSPMISITTSSESFASPLARFIASRSLLHFSIFLAIVG